MKIWRGFGSAHSSQLTVIGQFKNVNDAQLAEQVVEDFVNASWEERYPDVKTFIKAWQTRVPYVIYLNQGDFAMGIQKSCSVKRSDNILSVSDISSPEIGGIIKLMLTGGPIEVKITGTT
jgi:hypothetical protein